MEQNDQRTLDIADVLSRPEHISQYGKLLTSVPQTTVDHGSAPIGNLAAKLQEIIQELSQANPEQLIKRAGWMKRLLGGHIEARVDFFESVAKVDSLIAQAEELAEEVRTTLSTMDTALQEHRDNTADISYAIEMGKEYLQEHPDAGSEVDIEAGLRPARERFERRLANLATLNIATEMSITQLKMAKAQAIDLLDRFAEVTTVVVPMWRQNNLATGGGRDDAGTVNEAAVAHARLMESLKATLDAASDKAQTTKKSEHTA